MTKYAIYPEDFGIILKSIDNKYKLQKSVKELRMS